MSRNFAQISSRSRSGWSSAASIRSTGHGAFSGKRGHPRAVRTSGGKSQRSLRMNHAIDSAGVGAASRSAGMRPVARYAAWNISCAAAIRLRSSPSPTAAVEFHATAPLPQSSRRSCPCACMYALNSCCSAAEEITSAATSGRVTFRVTSTALPRGFATPLSSYSSGGSSLAFTSTSMGAWSSRKLITWSLRSSVRAPSFVFTVTRGSPGMRSESGARGETSGRASGTATPSASFHVPALRVRLAYESWMANASASCV